LSQRTLNLGILAHVDAGKTTLTERLLHTAGVIDEVGSVDAGTTQTDTLVLERQRGITIRSAVVSFSIGELLVNLIDTPGHPDFIAEVERSLSVLDAAVLVISAVEGVQSQTRVLMRALQRLHLPTLIFVNKTDRTGASISATLLAITERLSVTVVPTGVVSGLGSRETSTSPYEDEDPEFRAELIESLTEHNDQLLSRLLENDTDVSTTVLRRALATQTKHAQVVPVFFGSAITGAGVDALMEGIAELLPEAGGDTSGAVAGTVFKVERSPGSQKVAYVRLFSGTMHVRDRVHFGDAREGKITRLQVFTHGQATPQTTAPAGSVAKVWGLDGIKVGDLVSEVGGRTTSATQFLPPTLESVVAPDDPTDRSRLWVALTHLEEQDPLIGVRRNDLLQEISISLYGEVQKEVIAATLASEFALQVTFRDTTPICIERPLRVGEAVELLNAATNPFAATLGLRVEPRSIGAGVDLRLEVDHESVPLHLFRRVEDFTAAMHRYATEALEEGLSGWRVTDCTVTVTRCGYGGSDGPPSKRGPAPTFKDFQRLTAVVLMHALARAGTIVCQPMVQGRLEIPASSTGEVTAVLSRLGAIVQNSMTQGRYTVIETVLPVIRATEVQRQLPELTRGEGVLETSPAGYKSLSGDQPVRSRTSANPLNLKEYLSALP
jgi:ribosomal protection tetracycline resistance protein